MAYRAPGVEVIVQQNNRIINLSEDVRVPAIVGTGPTTLTVTDEAIERGASGSADQLAYRPVDTGSVILTNLPSTLAPTGSLNYDENLYTYGVDYTVDADGSINWTGVAGCVANPSLDEGEVFYAKYTRNVSATQYQPTTFVDSEDILNTYGAEDPGTAPLSIAGRMALENGAPAVILCQVSGSTSVANYRTAVDKLEKQPNVAYVVGVFPSGSMTLSDMRSVQSYLKTHADQMSQTTVGKERGVILGDASTFYASSGGISIDSATEISSYVSRAQAIDSQQVVYVAPAYGTRQSAAGATMVLDANYAAAALAGLITGQESEEIPVTGRSLSGYSIDDNRWSDFEMNRLGSAGATVLYAQSGVVKIRHALTTDVTSAETSEISVRDIERRVKRALRSGINNTFIGQGVVVNEDTVDDVVATTQSILEQLVQEGVIVSYGKVANPTTGEVPITATQDSTEPRRINVTCSYKPQYPLNYVVITVNTTV